MNGSVLAPYVPRLVVDWLRHHPDRAVQEVEGTLAFLDISGFTRLTERLAKRGKEGAEEMSDILNSTFSTLLDVGYQDGAGLVKWGGDAVLLLFDGPHHASRAARACLRMRSTLQQVGRLDTSAGAIMLRMSAGIHSGKFHFFLVGDPAHHRELLVAGPNASLTAALESMAKAGETLVSETTAQLIPERCLGRAIDPGRRLRAEPEIPTVGIPPAKSVDGLDISAVLPRGIREHLLEQPGEAEHRSIAVGFVEFSGTDAYFESRGPEALAEALHDVISNIQAATSRYGVTFFESDISSNGGKVMLTAGAPTSQGHDEDRLLRAARQIIDTAGPLPLRVGVNRGGVFAGDFGPPFRRTYSVKGDAINLAARTMSKADHGQVLATKETVDRAVTNFTITELPPFKVKGKTHLIEAALVGPVGKAEEHSLVTSPIRAREAELDLLRERVARALAGSGSVTTIAGDRGSGRSRLLAELPTMSNGARFASVTCDEYDVATPYLAVRRLFLQALAVPPDANEAEIASRVTELTSDDAELRPWAPLLGTMLGVEMSGTPQTNELDNEFRKARMEQVAIALLERELPGSAVLVLDDVHYLDEASHDLVKGILESARNTTPWAVFVTARSGRHEPWTDGDGDTLIELSPLSATESAQLITAETAVDPLPPSTVDGIVNRAGGNPLFLHGLLALARSGTGSDRLPETIEGLVTVEIDRLTPTHRRILRYASVLGTIVDTDLLARMLGENWIDPASRRFAPLRTFLSTTQTGHLQFHNALMREVAYGGLPFRRRRTLHEQAGAALLERSAGEDPEVERLAWHFHLADRAPESWRYGRLAAKRAQAQFAHAEAARFLGWAVLAGRRLGVEKTELADALEDLGDAQYLLGLSADARSTYQQAVRTAVDDPTRAAEVQLKLGRLDQRVGNLSQSLRRLTRGIQLVSAVDEPRALAVHAELATRYAIGRFQQGRYRDAQLWGDRAVSTAERSGDHEVLANSHNALEAITLWAGLTSDVAHGEVALALYEELGDIAGQGHSLNNLAIRAIFEGRWNEVQPLLSRAATLFEQMGDVTSLAAAVYNQADVLVRQGRSADAEPLLERALRIARSVDDEETVALVLRDWGKAKARAGKFTEANELLSDAIRRLADLGEPQELLDAEAAVAELTFLRGNAVEATQLAESALKRANDDNASVLPTLHRVRGFALLASDEVGAAAEAFDAGLELQSPAARHEMAFLMVGRAEAARRLGEPDADEFRARGADALRALGVEVAPFQLGVAVSGV